MNDPWDVKSVRQSKQYVSCMKINGVPLLPPVLSKECREEMLYYKLLAKEVEKRISLLKPYIVDSDSDSNEEKTDAPELPENEQNFNLPHNEIESDFTVNIDKITAVCNEVLLEKHHSSHTHSVTADCYSNLSASNSITTPTLTNTPKKYVIDLSLSINESGRNITENDITHSKPTSPIELPERDYNCTEIAHQKEQITDIISSNKSNEIKNKVADTNFSVNIDKGILSDPFPDLSISLNEPSSLSSKSFTGSLIDIYTESLKESQIAPKLIRQRSYTLLKPSPQLLAHLEVQSINTGVEMSCISMSESLSNLSSPNKKRRSWDLESAKVKWSSMALELKKKNIINAPKVNGQSKNMSAMQKKVQSVSPPRSKSVLQETPSRLSSKVLPKSDSGIKPNRKSISPVRNNPSSLIITKQPILRKTTTPKKENGILTSATQNNSDSEDPAVRVRQLYERIQKQQLLQMATLVEKQKREQLLLQQVFEEQNNLLYKQLKTICPRSPIEVTEALEDRKNIDSGPVSLSQLINHKPLHAEPKSPISDTLIQTDSYLNHCDDVLKRSKDITNSIKKQPNRVQNKKASSPKSKADTFKNKSRSPVSRNTSRRLNYDTTTSSEREYEPLLTDRTNDTMADLNVTFPTDHSDDNSFNLNDTVVNQFCGKDTTVVQRSPLTTRTPCSTPTTTDKKAQENVQNSCNRHQSKPKYMSDPTPQERAAATRIVSCARGYLVRRLLRTARVRGTVQTIRDALLCALQLHQDRAGIRGADVDLHRRLIQQITAACYTLHETFITSSPAERCAAIAADRARRRSLAARQSQDIMSQSHSGAFPARSKRSPPSPMTQSNYETFSGDKFGASAGRLPASPHRRPWR